MLSDEWLSRYELLKNAQCDWNADADTNEDRDADDRDDYNSSPCTSYSRAGKKIFQPTDPISFRHVSGNTGILGLNNSTTKMALTQGPVALRFRVFRTIA